MVVFQIQVSAVEPGAVGTVLPVPDVDRQRPRHLRGVAVVPGRGAQVQVRHALLATLAIARALGRPHVGIDAAPHVVEGRRPVVRPPDGASVTSLDEPVHDGLRQAGHRDALLLPALGMIADLLDEVRDRVAEPFLQLEDVGRRLAEVHQAVDLPDHVAVARMQLDDLDPVVLRGEHPVPGLGGRPPVLLRDSRTSLQRRRAQHAADRRRGGDTRRRQSPPPADPSGHGPAILSPSGRSSGTSRPDHPPDAP